MAKSHYKGAYIAETYITGEKRVNILTMMIGRYICTR